MTAAMRARNQGRLALLLLALGLATLVAKVHDAGWLPSNSAPPTTSLPPLECFHGPAQGAAVTIGFLGDSITHNRRGNSSPGEVAAGLLHAQAEICAVPGSTTADWVATARFTAAVAAFQAAHVHLVSVMLGTNDARYDRHAPVATYRSHLTAILAALQAAGFSLAVQSPPAVRNPLFDRALLAQYRRVIATLGLVGTRGAAVLPTLDGVHPTAAGVRDVGAAWAATLTCTLADAGQNRFGTRSCGHHHLGRQLTTFPGK